MYQRIHGDKFLPSVVVCMKTLKGAWPVLIVDFVEYMYRIRGTVEIPKASWDCSGLEPQPSEDSLTGLKNLPGSKRRSCETLPMEIRLFRGACKPNVHRKF